MDKQYIKILHALKEKYTTDDRFHGNRLYGEILTRKEPIRTLGFTSPYNKRSLSLRKTD